MKVKKGDKVQIIAGKDKGKEGAITKILKEQNKVVVEGLNVYKKHVKGGGDKGQIIEFAAPMDVSNVKTLKATTAPKKAAAKKTTKK